jgi:hypothetical protein
LRVCDLNFGKRETWKKILKPLLLYAKCEPFSKKNFNPRVFLGLYAADGRKTRG